MFNQKLGDMHNFGQAVIRLDEKTIFKPRCVFWEWLFFDGSSPLRLFASQVFPPHLNFFDILPTLNVLIQSRFFGVVDFFPERSNFETESVKNSDALKLGAAIAFMTWMGITDLHYENVRVQIDSAGRLQFAPLDIEAVFYDLELPSQTRLVPPKRASRQDFYGLTAFRASLTPAEIPLVALCLSLGFRQMYEFLNRSSREIVNHLSKIEGILEQPVRVILKPTSTYYSSLKKWPLSNTSKETYFYEEQIQLERGDIPYFFRFPGNKTILYFVDNIFNYEEVMAKEILEERVPLHSFETLCRKVAQNSIDAGSLQLARFMSEQVDVFEAKHASFKLKILKSQIQLFISSGVSICCKR